MAGSPNSRRDPRGAPTAGPPARGPAVRRSTNARPDAAPAARVPAPAAPPAPITTGAPGLGNGSSRLAAGWVLVPLRLFLGVTFVYAGLQKLTDPQFFDPHAIGYIGRQIQGFAHGSPIGGLLLTVALPHAAFYGGLIAYGELAIGLGALVGLLARPAACFGLLLSLIFFLSATWNVHPYFYGADIVFVFAWLTLGLQPHAGLPNLDDRAAVWLAGRWPRWVAAHPTALALLFSIPAVPSVARVAGADAIAARRAPATTGRGRHARPSGARLPSRREFLTGLGAGAVGMLGLVWLWNALHPAATLPTSLGGSGEVGNPTVPVGGTPGATPVTTAASGSNVIARASDVPTNSSASFTIPSNGDPGVLVHLNNGRFVAFDATCTHAGCPVQYDPSSADLICPCHGAVFDPSQNAAVLQGPTNTPLTPVAVTVQSNGDIVLS